jgi:glutamate dehydrogenase
MTFTFRLGEETGAAPSDLARGYAAAREIFAMRSLWAQVQALDNLIDAHLQLGMLLDARRLVERATRWLARERPRSIDIAQTISSFEPGARMLAAAMPDVLDGADRDAFDARVAELLGAGVPAQLAARVAGLPLMLSVFDIVEVAAALDRDLLLVTETYFGLASRLGLTWLRDRIAELPRANRWQSLARSTLREDLGSLQRALTAEVLDAVGADDSAERAIDRWWTANRPAIDRCLGMLADVRASRIYDTTTLPVALREIRSLVHGSRVTGATA